MRTWQIERWRFRREGHQLLDLRDGDFVELLFLMRTWQSERSQKLGEGLQYPRWGWQFRDSFTYLHHDGNLVATLLQACVDDYSWRLNNRICTPIIVSLRLSFLERFFYYFGFLDDLPPSCERGCARATSAFYSEIASRAHDEFRKFTCSRVAWRHRQIDVKNSSDNLGQFYEFLFKLGCTRVLYSKYCTSMRRQRIGDTKNRASSSSYFE